MSLKRWVGIDEAGYGPNLGPLVMSAVTAVGPADHEFDLWGDLAPGVCREHDPSRRRLRVDDSKRILAKPQGRAVLLKSAYALLDAVGAAPGEPSTVLNWFRSAGCEADETVELGRWLDVRAVPAAVRADFAGAANPLRCARWRLESARAQVVAPVEFNRRLALSGSKADVHFSAFACLLRGIWADARDGVPTLMRCDKHGGRHFYLERLYEALPDAEWIDRGVEGPELSEYVVRAGCRTMSVEFRPRSDSSDGLVALASILCKTLREVWMEVFNAFWQRQVLGLRPTAGYPVDARRFREAIEAKATELGLPPLLWWRER